MKKNFLIIQIDGLGYDILEKSLENGYLPFLKSLLKEKKFFLKKFNCGLPAITSRFQSEIMYGESKNIPGMMWYDKKESKFFSCFTYQAKEVESLRKNKGILEDGVSIGNVFDGGAEKSFTISSFFGLSLVNFPRKTSLVLMIFLPFLIIFDFFYSVFFRKRRGVFLEIFIGEPLIRKEIINLVKEFIEERKNIYFNLIGYDAISHAFGRESKKSFKFLNKIDREIEVLYNLAKENYYIFILSDHGQIDCVSFKKIIGKSLKEVIEDEIKEENIIDGDKIKTALIFKGILNGREKFTNNNFLKILYRIIFEIFKRYYKSSFFQNLPYFFSEKGILLINQGDICQIYFLKEKRKVFIEEINEKYPELLRTLLDCWGIDLIVGFSKEKKIQVFGERKLSLNEKKLVSSLIKMENSGDIILFGRRIGEKIVNFSEGKLTCHGGFEKEEQEIFIISPFKFKNIIQKIESPRALYRIFVK